MYDAHAAAVYGYVCALLADPAEAEDVVQAVFLRALEQSKRWFGLRNPAGYLYRAARNEALSRLRKREVRSRKEPEMERAWMMLQPAGPDMEAQEAQAEVNAALLSLPLEQREVVVLKLYQDHSFKEIAALTGISKNTAASRYRYALKKLREVLDKAEVSPHGPD